MLCNAMFNIFLFVEVLVGAYNKEEKALVEALLRHYCKTN